LAEVVAADVPLDHSGLAGALDRARRVGGLGSPRST
jgi:hypothetical protein